MESTIGDIEVGEHAGERYLLRIKKQYPPYRPSQVHRACSELKDIFRTSEKSKYVRPIPHIGTVVYSGTCPKTEETVWIFVERNRIYTVLSDDGYTSRYIKTKDGELQFVGDKSKMLQIPRAPAVSKRTRRN